MADRRVRVHLSTSASQAIASGKLLDKRRFALLSVDPGSVHVGYAFWREDDTFAHAGEVGPSDIIQMIKDSRPLALVCEAFSLRSPIFGAGASKPSVETIMLIGRIQQTCLDQEVSFYLQQPSVRGVAQKSPYWRELAENGDLDSNPHSRSAIAHGLYHLKFRKT